MSKLSRESIIILLEHEISIEKKLKQEYMDAWLEAVSNGDEIRTRCNDELIAMAGGEILAYERAIELIKEGKE